MAFLQKINTHFIKASSVERKLFIKTFIYMVIVRFWMLKVKFSRYQKHLGEIGKESTHDFPHHHLDLIQTIRKVVKATSKNTPWESKCMVQAISCKWLLKSYGIESTIYFGVKKDLNFSNKLKAHAWLRVGELIATGREGHKRFKIVNFYS